MYHAISDQVDRSVSAYYRTVTSRAAFARQMRYLFDTGFSAVTLSEALASWKMPSRASDAGSAPRREVVVTFDDGFGDIYTDALPILRRFGFRATVFLSTDYIGRNFVTGRQCLDEDQIRRLMHGGIEFGSHTASHPQLHNLDFEQIRVELIRSKERIEQIIGNAVTLFSYPYRFPEEDEDPA